MKQFTMVFTTRHRNVNEVEKDCQLICGNIVFFATKYEYHYNGKELIVFHVYNTSKVDREKILFSIIRSLQMDARYKAMDLQSYTKD